MLALKEKNGLLWIRAGGRQGDEAYDRFVPQFEHIAEREAGTVPMVIELAPDFSGWNFGGLWRDLKFDIRHEDCFGRIAIIGDSEWEEWGTKLSSSLFRTEMKFIRPTQRSHAESWVQTEEDAA